MQEKEFVLYLLPLFFGPIVLGFLIDFFKKTHRYRLNDLLANLSLGLANSVVGLVFAVISLSVYKIFFDNFALLDLNQMDVSTWIMAFLLYDFLYYWAHRSHHTIAILWGSHVVHHSGEDMNYSLGIRQGLLSELTAWPFFIPLAVFGISVELFLVMNAIQVIYQYFIHTTLVPKLGWVENVFMTPALHRVHHARNKPYIDKNHGNILVVWDKLFKSYQRELDEVPPVFGVRESIPSYSPIAINLQYYKVILKKVTQSKSVQEMMKSLFSSPSWLPLNVEAGSFYNDTSKIPSKDFKKYNPEISNIEKFSSGIRFIALLFLILFMIWNLSTYEWWVSLSLFTLFLWMIHYNGLTLDGIGLSWKLEIITQSLLVSVAIIVTLFSSYHHLIIPVTIVISVLSIMSSFLLYLFMVNKKSVGVH